jgi:hypothetical protein
MTALTEGITEVQALVSADGARLHLLDSTPASVHLRLDLEDASCADCVLPAQHLTTVVADVLRRHTGNAALKVRIDDPREAAG